MLYYNYVYVLYIIIYYIPLIIPAIPTIRNLVLSKATNSSLSFSWNFPISSDEPIQGFEVGHFSSH